MKKIIAGKTILLNTVTNTTFIASNLDEKVQSGTRENDQHIEWTGELDIEVICKDDIDAAMREVWDKACEAHEKRLVDAALNHDIAKDHPVFRRFFEFMKENPFPRPVLSCI